MNASVHYLRTHSPADHPVGAPAAVPLDATLPSPSTPSAARAVLVGRPAAARHLGIGTTTLDGLIGSGELPSVRIGRRVLVHVDDLAAFVESRRSTTSDGAT